MPQSTSLRLKWSHTWPDKGADFSCRDHDGDSVGRIYKMTSSTMDNYRWFWAAHGRLPGSSRSANAHGHAPTKLAAAEAVEAAWFDAIEAMER